MNVNLAESFFCDHRTGFLSVLLIIVLKPESCGVVIPGECGAPVDVKTICHASVSDYAFYHFNIIIFTVPIGLDQDMISYTMS